MVPGVADFSSYLHESFGVSPVQETRQDRRLSRAVATGSRR